MAAVLSNLRHRPAWVAGALLAGGASLWWPGEMRDVLGFVIASLFDVAPLIGVGLLLSAWMAASGAGAVTAELFKGHAASTIVAASALGAATPVCGVTVLPLMTGFLASGVPLAPVMAFWLSSPVTDPGLFAATWATLGPVYAIGKTIAAFALGLIAGVGTAAVAALPMVRQPLRSRRRAREPERCDVPAEGFRPRFWSDTARLRTFKFELVSQTRLVMLCLVLAFTVEYLLRDLVPPDVLADYVGADSSFAIPLAVSVGAPLYLDGYAALPVVRGLLDLGMSPGAGLAFLVAGSALSIWGVLAVVPILRASTTALFISLAILGSLAIGYVFDWVSVPLR